MIRHQTAPLPTTHLNRCVAAYAAGNHTLGAHLYAAAHTEITPIVRRVITRTIKDRHDREDAEQRAHLKIWQQITKGITPDVKLVTYHTAIDQWRESSGMGDARTLTRAQHTAARHHANIDEHPRASIDPGFMHAIDNTDAQAIIHRLSEHRPIWGLVAAGLSYGFTQSEIARALHHDKSTISRMVADIRTHLTDTP